MNSTILLSILVTGIMAGTPILLAATGEIIAERSGVLNMGVEGMMLIGAVTAFIASARTGSLGIALAASMLTGGAAALIMAFLAVTLRANQVACGIALTIFGTGLSAYLGKTLIGAPPVTSLKPVSVPGLSAIPGIGGFFAKFDAMVYAAALLALAVWFVLFRTKIGLMLRSCGENPAASDSAGIGVFAARYGSVAAGGVFAGLGGAYLALAFSPSWVENMTAGRGWIAIALVVFAMWNPMRALLGSYIFGIIDSLGLHLQAAGVTIPSFVLKMLPYLFTLAVLIAMTRETKTRRAATPASLGVPYSREER